jgi:hypothetical protein
MVNLSAGGRFMLFFTVTIISVLAGVGAKGLGLDK